MTTPKPPWLVPTENLVSWFRSRGNVFIGTGFSDPQTLSRVENIYIVHWRNRV